MTVRIGVVGAGFIARYHAMQLRLIAEPNEIVAVHDIDPARAEAFAAEEGGIVVDSVDEVIAVSDAVIVCTWTAAHLEVVRRVVASGRPVFCEKPLGRDLAEATALVDAVAQAGVANMVGLVLRTSPALAAVRSLVHDDRSGAVMNVVFRDDQYLPTQGMYASTWRGERDLAGAGTLLEHSSHDVDILEWLLGEVVGVAAQSSYAHGLDGVEDSVSVLLRFASGATGTLSSVWHDVLSRPSQRRIEIFCERALVTLEGDLFGPVRYQRTDEELVLDGDELVSWLHRRGVPLHTSEQDFVSAVRELGSGTQATSGPLPRLSPDVHDAWRAHELVDAIYRSAAAGGAPVATPRRV